jgi:hypothetical protein
MRLLVLVLVALVIRPALAEQATRADPLFQADSTLDIRIAGPLETLMKERPTEEELPARLSWTEADGRPVTVDVEIRTRGNFRRRREVCPFAPVRLDVAKKEVAGTLFDGQDKLKLVTHCRTGSRRAEQFVLREFLTYRMYNLLADASYRVRLLRITWENTEDKGKSFVAYGFVIESAERLARRIDRPFIEIRGNTDEALLDPATTNLQSVFQYFIGNTDFSPIAGPPDDICCHNVTLFGAAEGPLYPVPYDFDMAGMVNSDYAAPSPSFRLRDVQSRLYRGRCRFEDRLPDTLALFEREKDALYATLDLEGALADWSRKDMRRFIDAFYAALARPDELRAGFTESCVR